MFFSDLYSITKGPSAKSGAKLKWELIKNAKTE